eukprot:CAMPEP_0204597728 /NCGR_PEP_ID=MMETSP0661-20131031/53953_1 /ASSEMBLY_ACC=CAM_ASM_000606 /TAXON_ID=109239 /ORGANISM="Alexandrium margalefi, Strain AMGDE01CS-322" /LENGTH=452 /DNA_ID=CAMNT_0051608425 /DNA_START=65 /DNA_END=1423 /DNA_ORIENTATION=-
MKGQALLITRPSSSDKVKPGQALMPLHCRIAQQMIKRAVSQSEVQAKFDELEKAAGYDEQKYSKRLSGYLLSKVYPPVVQHFGFEDPVMGAQAVFNGIAQVQPESLEVTLAWLELETLMRNKSKIRLAQEALDQMRRPLGQQALPQEAQAPPKLEAQAPPPKEAQEPEDFGGLDQEVWGVDGSLLGVVEDGRVRGGCKEVGCQVFGPSQLVTDGVRICRHCGMPATEHEDKGPFAGVAAGGEDEEEEEEEEEQLVPFTARVICSTVAPQSTARTFHVELPGGATVADLRANLAWGLPPTAVVRPVGAGKELRPLQNSDRVPLQVSVSEFTGQVTPFNVLTKTQAKNAQAMLMSILETPDMKAKLNTIDKDTSGHQGKFRMRLMQLLVKEVYPEVHRKLGLPDNTDATLAAIQNYTGFDADMVNTWLKLETLMRRPEGIKAAQEALQKLKSGK